MPTKALPIDKPTRRTIEALFRELQDEGGRELQNRANEAYRELQALEARLLKNPAYLRLYKRYDALHRRASDQRDKIRAEVRRVRLLYQAKGLTPEVQKEIDKLVTKYA